jgi:CHASE3 domain sensor protein
MTFKYKVIAGFGTALAILIFVGVLSYRSMKKSDEERQWVIHTHIVLETLDAIFANVLDIESGVRGFLLTGKETYLETYSAAVGQV